VSGLHKTALIDADILAFKVASKAQTCTKWPGAAELSVNVDPWEDVVHRIQEMVRDWTARAGAGNTMICLSCPSDEGWRVNQVLPSYKGNRKDSVRPALLADVKQYMEDNYPSFRKPTLEADDIMGILSTHPTLVKGRKVIVSSDKDMKTIPGWLFNQDLDKKPWRVDLNEADRWHLYQTLMGDTTDGYAGCPGVGPKRAAEVLSGWVTYAHPTVWDAVVRTYESKGLTEADALIQARVARICRASDYNFKTKEVILWTPQAAA